MVEQRRNIKHDFILEFLDHEIVFKEGHAELVLHFEQAESSLREIMNKRVLSQVKFSAEELTNLLQSLLKAVAYLEQCEMVHGNLCPETVVSVGEVWKVKDNLCSQKSFLETQYLKILN